MGVYSQHGSVLQVYARAPPAPLGTEATAGNLKPMMSSSESRGYRQSVRKCTKPKVNITQLLGLIVLTVAQLWWIKGFADKVRHMCEERRGVFAGEVCDKKVTREMLLLYITYMTVALKDVMSVLHFVIVCILDRSQYRIYCRKWTFIRCFLKETNDDTDLYIQKKNNYWIATFFCLLFLTP